jgi:hypothetical protein
MARLAKKTRFMMSGSIGEAAYSALTGPKLCAGLFSVPHVAAEEKLIAHYFVRQATIRLKR